MASFGALDYAERVAPRTVSPTGRATGRGRATQPGSNANERPRWIMTSVCYFHC